jgi:hypothetical protein
MDLYYGESRNLTQLKQHRGAFLFFGWFSSQCCCLRCSFYRLSPFLSPKITRLIQVSGSKPPFALVVCQVIFFPSQGFFNMLIYLRPRYMRMAAKHPDASQWTIITQVFFPTSAVVDRSSRLTSEAEDNNPSRINQVASTMRKSAVQFVRRPPKSARPSNATTAGQLSEVNGPGRSSVEDAENTNTSTTITSDNGHGSKRDLSYPSSQGNRGYGAGVGADYSPDNSEPPVEREPQKSIQWKDMAEDCDEGLVLVEKIAGSPSEHGNQIESYEQDDWDANKVSVNGVDIERASPPTLAVVAENASEEGPIEKETVVYSSPSQQGVSLISPQGGSPISPQQSSSSRSLQEGCSPISPHQSASHSPSPQEVNVNGDDIERASPPTLAVVAENAREGRPIETETVVCSSPSHHGCSPISPQQSSSTTSLQVGSSPTSPHHSASHSPRSQISSPSTQNHDNTNHEIQENRGIHQAISRSGDSNRSHGSHRSSKGKSGFVDFESDDEFDEDDRY